MQSSNILKVGLGILVFALFLFLYLTRESNPEYDWSLSFKPVSREPYGTFLFHELLKSATEEGITEIKAPLAKLLSDPEITNTSYVFIGDIWYFDPEGREALLDYVDRGNQVYIIARDFRPHGYIDNGLADSSTNYLELVGLNSIQKEKVTIKTNAGGPEKYLFNLAYLQDWEQKPYYWSYIDTGLVSYMGDAFVEKGQYHRNLPNWAVAQIGDGSLTVHTTPLAFTNFYLRDKAKFSYANQVLAYMNKGRIYWDSFNHIPIGPSQSKPNPLSFILGQTGLRWAWYLLLISGLIYLIFYTRRRQRAIPVITPQVNTSLEFVKTLGGMYFQQSAHASMLKHQYELFLHHVRTHYGMATGSLDEDFVAKLSLKSGFDETRLQEIIDRGVSYEKRENAKVDELISYYQLTQSFYRNSK